MFNPLGCHSARNMIRIEELPCPKCGQNMELFIREGLLAVEGRCDFCGNIIAAGTPAEEVEHAAG